MSTKIAFWEGISSGYPVPTVGVLSATVGFVLNL